MARRGTEAGAKLHKFLQIRTPNKDFLQKMCEFYANLAQDDSILVD